VRVWGVSMPAPKLTPWRLSALAGIAYSATMLSANGADMPTPQPVPSPPPIYQPGGSFGEPVPGNQFEARFGPFFHGVGSQEHDTFDLNASILTPRLDFGMPGYWAYLLPRFQLGGAVNLEGRTSFAYADIALNLPIFSRLFFEPFAGIAGHNGSLTPTSTLSGLGCPLLFHAGFTFGVPINEHWNVLATFEHLSNGRSFFGVNCGTNEGPGGNQGLNNYGISIGYAF